MPSIVTGREVVYVGADAGRWAYGVMGMFGHFSVDSTFSGKWETKSSAEGKNAWRC